MNQDTSKASLAIVTDSRNDATHTLLEVITGSSSFGRTFPNLGVISDPLHQNIKSDQGFSELTRIFAKEYDIAVVALGVPNRTDYEQKIHRLLDAWNTAKNKPVLSVLSAEPAETSKHIESWPGWQFVAEGLKPSIRVSPAMMTPDSLARELAQDLQTHRDLEPERLKAAQATPSPLAISRSQFMPKRDRTLAI